MATREENNTSEHFHASGEEPASCRGLPALGAVVVQSTSKRQSPVGEENRVIHVSENSTYKKVYSFSFRTWVRTVLAYFREVA